MLLKAELSLSGAEPEREERGQLLAGTAPFAASVF
jgi:hypothetical protein